MLDKRFKQPPDLEARLADMVTKGFSQYRMARELGVSRLTVRRWLHDHGYHLTTQYVRVSAGKKTLHHAQNSC